MYVLSKNVLNQKKKIILHILLHFPLLHLKNNCHLIISHNNQKTNHSNFLFYSSTSIIFLYSRKSNFQSNWLFSLQSNFWAKNVIKKKFNIRATIWTPYSIFHAFKNEHAKRISHQIILHLLFTILLFRKRYTNTYDNRNHVEKSLKKNIKIWKNKVQGIRRKIN